MKKITITLLLFITCFTMFAQDNQMATNELKLNMSNLIGFKWFDVGYEHILNEESSIGASLLFSLDKDSEGLDEYRTFSLTPYYRHFFSNKYAAGFFVEAFTMIHSGEEEISNSISTDEKYTDLAVGISVGTKWVSNRGFVAEIYAGIGRDMFDQSDLEIVGRGGVSIGYRF
ncbi:DUF3575 domain-containing protein [Lutibacter sp. TH_r2]|uniref:DUF3575 domain-containing protein n=1 Tax=Lutibacter sp. TH_r2 TaxID=3082083 RepID=UPI0029547D8D|nr:DUF3575 domain-containing protein [Lutibacter sp. TH_r2]MDV7186242.1 DUF3575 domain-containing protein [Lutibacter sp. TH_r2]